MTTRPRVLPSLQALGKARLQGARHRRHPAASSTKTASQAEQINKVLEGRPHIEDAIRNRQVQLVFNTTEGQKAVSDSKSLRRAALMMKVPYFTTVSGALAAAQGSRGAQGRRTEGPPLAGIFQLN